MPRASQDYNLYLLKPNLVIEWHPSKNGNLRPRDVTPGSGKKVWWLCTEGHEWQAAIYSRSRGSGCPHCNKNHLINDDELMLSDLSLAKEWHPTKNGDLKPRDVDSNFGEKVWWLCEEGYEWQATVKSRMEGAGCPRCGRAIMQKRSTRNGTKIKSGKTIGEDELQSINNNFNIGPSISEMHTGTDFRREKRYMFQDTISLENQESEQWTYARSVNISGSGLLIESEIPYNRGAKVLVQFSCPPFKSMKKINPSIVRWCKELPYDSTDSSYGVGVEFISSIYFNKKLLSRFQSLSGD
jgi:hypothetical protein